MKQMSTLHHFLVPHHSNNQKARLLHSGSLALMVGLFTVFQIAVTELAFRFPDILGYASQIPVSEILAQTNRERLAHGLSGLSLDSKLSAAAAQKAADMFAKNYWAHVSPSGTQPWYFITASGYTYRYAGENLARDFSDPSSVVIAWMNSPTHRDNLLSSRYQDVGVAVVDGVLEGRETTLVVQMFGAKLASAPAVSGTSASVTVKAKETEKIAVLLPTVTPPPRPTATIAPTASPVPQVPLASAYLANTRNPLSPYDLTRYASLGLLLLLSAVLVVDIVVINRRKIVRWTGKSLAHLIFLLVIAIAAGSILRGQIL